MSPSTTIQRPYHRTIKADSSLYALRPDDRLRAAQARHLARRDRKAIENGSRDWPPFSPGALNSWLLLVTTKPPSWRDPIVLWPEAPPTLGAPHEGFFYPDPLGFWAEVRRWVSELFRPIQPTWAAADGLSVTTLLHMGDVPERFEHARKLTQPRMILFLDEPSYERVGLNGFRRESHFIHDPHRKGQVYEGFWGKAGEGVVIGKSPQHPSTHNLYRAADMAEYLRSAPRPEGV